MKNNKFDLADHITNQLSTNNQLLPGVTKDEVYGVIKKVLGGKDYLRGKEAAKIASKIVGNLYDIGVLSNQLIPTDVVTIVINAMKAS